MKRWISAAVAVASAAPGAAAPPASRADRPAPVRCGAVQRPGVAMLGADGQWRGPAVDLCRAIARATNGPEAPISFRSYDDLADLGGADQDQVAFLSSAERNLPALSDRLTRGSVAAAEKQVLMVPASSPIRRGSDLAGRIVCFMIGSAAEDALDSWSASQGIRVERLALQEPDEMRDAYAVGKCAALAGDAVEVADDVTGQGASRLLDEPIATLPILAATPARFGAAWAAKVADAVRLSAIPPATPRP